MGLYEDSPTGDRAAERSLLITTSSFDIDSCAPLDELRSQGWSVVTNPHGRRLREDEVAQMLTESGATAMIAGTEPLTEPVFAQNPQLRWISRCGAGLDSVDLASAAGHGIAVTSTPHAPAAAVAELTVALILAAARRIPEADRAVRDGRWSPLMGALVGDKTVGVIGCGQVGKLVAGLLHGFGCTLLGFDTEATDFGLCTPLERLDDLCERSDIVTVHVPLTPATRHLVGASQMNRIGANGILVNASRGGVVDEVALVDALREGRLGAAALDVFEQEPYDGPLTALPNVVLTAHMGSLAREARQEMEHEAAQNLLDAIIADAAAAVRAQS